MTKTAARLYQAGFPFSQYAETYDSGVYLEDGPSQRALDTWIADLPQAIKRGTWLLLLGGVGVGKSMSLCRVADAWLRARPDQRILFVSARELATDLLAWARAREAMPVEVELAMRVPLLLVDDLDRWLTMSPHDIERGRILYQWDAMAEVRNRPGVATVVACNRTAKELATGMESARWYDRARGSGLVLEIPGRSRR